MRARAPRLTWVFACRSILARAFTHQGTAIMVAPIAFPGRYTPEPSVTSHVIEAVPTSVAAFVGHAAEGPVNQAQKLLSLADYQAIFGGPHTDSDLPHAVSHFFQNGGGTCWVVRAAEDSEASQADAASIAALDAVRDLNIIALPGQTDAAILARAIAYAEERRAMIILDMDAAADTPERALDWVRENPALLSPNAAAYFPRLRMADALPGGSLRSSPNSGAMAGLWARTDGTRGIWKAPAGTESNLRGVRSPDYALTEAENALLNPHGLNCIRSFPSYGIVSWGARTLAGADRRASEWKYIPVRRLALFIEESITRSLRFAIFRPNDDALWSLIRLMVGNFMQGMFRQGAFQGSTARDAYIVRCDAGTTTHADIAQGTVVLQVGFAPLKPAEFVIITIRQNAGQGAD